MARACPFVLVVSVVSVALLVDGCNPETPPTAGAQVPEVAERKSWSFTTPIPEGFSFVEERQWNDYTFSVLEGATLGRVHETLLVIRSTEETLPDGVKRAANWALEFAFAIPIGESRPNKHLDPDGQFDTAILLDKDDQMFLAPCRWAAMTDPFLGGIVNPFEIGMDELGLPSDAITESVLAWATCVKETPLIVAWAGRRADSSARQELVATLCKRMEAEWGQSHAYAQRARRKPRASLRDTLPRSYRLVDMREHDGVQLWVFRGRHRHEVTDTVLIAHWKNRTDPFFPLVNCARWASEIAVGRTPTPIDKGFITDHITLVKKEDGRRRALERPTWAQRVDHSGTLSLADMFALGEQRDPTPRFPLSGAADDAEADLLLSAVSRAAAGENGTFMVWAGANAAVSRRAFWRIVDTVDDFASACLEREDTLAELSAWGRELGD